MLANHQPPQIHLPRGWQGYVKSAVLYAIALAHYSIVYARAWAADSINARVRLAAENDQLQEECALLREELLIKDSRITQIPPPYQFRTSSNVRSKPPVPPRNTSFATRASSSGVACSRIGVTAVGSNPASAPLVSTGVSRSLNDSF